MRMMRTDPLSKSKWRTTKTPTAAATSLNSQHPSITSRNHHLMVSGCFSLFCPNHADSLKSQYYTANSSIFLEADATLHPPSIGGRLPPRLPSLGTMPNLLKNMDDYVTPDAPGWAKTSSTTFTTSNGASRSRTPPGLAPVLPLELLHMIYAELPRSSLVVSLRANKFFHTFAIKKLYSHLVLPRNTLWPSLVDKPVKDPFSDKKKKLPNHQKRAYLAKYVQHLDIHAHSIATCCPPGSGSPSFPPMAYLKMVRVVLTDGVGHRDFHIQHGLPCNVLSHLRPRTLVVRGAPLVYDKVPPLFTTLLLSKVEDYVCVVTPDNIQAGHLGGIVMGCGVPGLVESVPLSASTFTIVFETPGPDFKWRPRPVLYFPDGPAVPDREWIMSNHVEHSVLKETINLERSWVGTVIKDLAAFACGETTSSLGPIAVRPNIKINLVNSGSLTPVERNSKTFTHPMEDLVNCLFKEMVYRVVSRPEERLKILERVQFLTMREYLEEEEWEGVFDPEEVAPWFGKGGV